MKYGSRVHWGLQVAHNISGNEASHEFGRASKPVGTIAALWRKKVSTRLSNFSGFTRRPVRMAARITKSGGHWRLNPAVSMTNSMCAAPAGDPAVVGAVFSKRRSSFLLFRSLGRLRPEEKGKVCC